MCQDTGTVIVNAKKGRNVFVKGDDSAALSAGAKAAYAKKNLRYSQLAPLSMYKEKNTGNNLRVRLILCKLMKSLLYMNFYLLQRWRISEQNLSSPRHQPFK